MFGSSNFDARSSEINEELDLVVYDEGFGREMESDFEKDLANREYTLEQFRSARSGSAHRWLTIPFRSQL